MACYYCNNQRYELCKNICIHKLRNPTILDIINDETSYFMKDNLIYKNDNNTLHVITYVLL